MKNLRQGFIRGFGIFLGLITSGLLAYTVSGTIKTWNSGDSLNASDLNATIQSLKTALEDAKQVGTAYTGTNVGPTIYYQSFMGGPGTITTESQMQWPATRSGTVKSARIALLTNACTVTSTVTLRKNGADTTIVLSIPAGSLTQVTSANSVTFVAGDLLAWQISCGAANQVPLGNIFFEF